MAVDGLVTVPPIAHPGYLKRSPFDQMLMCTCLLTWESGVCDPAQPHVLGYIKKKKNRVGIQWTPKMFICDTRL